MAGPYFIPDLSSWEGALPNFDAIAATPSMVGCIIKSSQGVSPGVSLAHGHSPLWFQLNWPRVRAAGGNRYGRDWLRGCYHYGEPTPSGGDQADYMLAAVDRAGGWGDGDLPPAWDLEGAAWTSAQQVIDVSSQFAERVARRLNRPPILYTGSVWRKLGIRVPAGFDKLWTPHPALMVPFGWPAARIALHQYVGDGAYWDPGGVPAQLNYPTSVHGLDAKIDMNVVLDEGAPATSIERVREVLVGRGSFIPATRGRRWIPLAVGAGLFLAGAWIASRTRDAL